MVASFTIEVPNRENMKPATTNHGKDRQEKSAGKEDYGPNLTASSTLTPPISKMLSSFNESPWERRLVSKLMMGEIAANRRNFTKDARTGKRSFHDESTTRQGRRRRGAHRNRRKTPHRKLNRQLAKSSHTRDKLGKKDRWHAANWLRERCRGEKEVKIRGTEEKSWGCKGIDESEGRKMKGAEEKKMLILEAPGEERKHCTTVGNI